MLAALGVESRYGLSEAEASRRLAVSGPNELARSRGIEAWRILWEQFTAVLPLVLVGACLISAALGDYRDAVAIAVILILNAALGFSHEYRAEKAMASLAKLTVPVALVRRGGVLREISSPLLVPGDVMLLTAGDYIAADCRLIEAVCFETQEAALTGESAPIAKNADILVEPGLAVGDRKNMAYMGTYTVAGRAEAVVTETGMDTELGQIAALLQKVRPEPTPLQRGLDRLGRSLAVAALAIVAVIFLLGLGRGEDLRVLFLTAVSIGVAAVPEGLPAVVTIALALGAQRMLQRRALVRKLAAVEALGAVTVICADKTGTLTENRMTVTVLELGGKTFELDAGASVASDASVQLLLAAGALCNDTRISSDKSVSQANDPTEAALAAVADRFGLSKMTLDEQFPRLCEAPFTSERRRMTTVHQLPPGEQLLAPALGETSAPYIAFTKGAVDSLLECCSEIWTEGRAEPIDQARRDAVTKGAERMASQGLRTLGLAFRRLKNSPAEGIDAERDLTWIGLAGIMDPPRPEAFGAVAKCKTAGIRTVMITGDHPLTAESTASRVGIAGEAPTITGKQLESLTDPDLDRAAGASCIFARVSPLHKLRIVESLQRRGQIVAMTGDGVNDAPALKKADIGVAMGIAGTDVACDSADIVLLDDNFATMVGAVEEGRLIYDNIRKFVRYIVTTNSGEIWVMLVAPLLGMPLPLLPLQILWMNLVTDGLPALALGVEPPEANLMDRPPYRPGESIFARGLGRHVLWVGLLMGALSLGTGYWYWRVGDPRWQTLLFSTLTLAQMAHVLAIRSEYRSLFQIGLLSNKPLLAAVSVTLAFQLALIYLPPLQSIFQTTSLTAQQLGLTFGVSAVIFVAVEMEKHILSRKR